VADFTAAIEREPFRANAYVQRSMVHERLGDWQAAVYDLTAAELYRLLGPVEEYDRAMERLRRLSELTG